MERVDSPNFDSGDWLRPDEVRLWSGRPEVAPLITRSDIPLTLMGLFYCAFATFWMTHVGPMFIFGIPVAGLGLYMLVGRYFYKSWLFHNAQYAVTSQRFVEWHADKPCIELSRDAKYTVRHDPAHDRTSIDFVVGNTLAVTQSSMFRLSGAGSFPPSWKGGGLTFQNLLSVEAENAIVAIESRSTSTDNPVTPVTRQDMEALAKVPDSWFTTSRGSHERRVIWWIRTRLFRRSYSVATSLAVDEALAVLQANVRSESVFAMFAVSTGTIVGKVSGDVIKIRASRGGTQNSWRWQFRGRISPTDAGSELVGTVGPDSFTPVFSAVWTAPLLILLAVIIGVFISRLFGGQYSTLFHGAGLVLIPIVFLSGFVAITEFSSRAAAREWAAVDELIREMLQPWQH